MNKAIYAVGRPAYMALFYFLSTNSVVQKGHLVALTDILLKQYGQSFEKEKPKYNIIFLFILSHRFLHTVVLPVPASEEAGR